MNILHFTDERVADVRAGAPLTAAEREFLVTHTPSFEECQPETEADLRAMTDAGLMAYAYGVWADYAQGQV